MKTVVKMKNKKKQDKKVIVPSISIMDNNKKISRETSEIFVTLTAINDRLDKIFPVLESLHNQILMPKRIILNISEEPYLLDKGISRNDPRLTKLLELPLVEINWTKNTGPYRKIVPFMEDFFSKKEVMDKLFITIDDDTIYPDYFVQTLYDKYMEHDCVVAFRGRCISINDKTIKDYDDWTPGENKPSINNLPTGKDGIIYSTKFFTREFINISEAIKLAPTADDLWIKWHTALNGIESLILNPEATRGGKYAFPIVDNSLESQELSLYGSHNSKKAGGKNDFSIRQLESYFTHQYGYNVFSACKESFNNENH